MDTLPHLRTFKTAIRSANAEAHGSASEPNLATHATHLPSLHQPHTGTYARANARALAAAFEITHAHAVHTADAQTDGHAHHAQTYVVSLCDANFAHASAVVIAHARTDAVTDAAADGAPHAIAFSSADIHADATDDVTFEFADRSISRTVDIAHEESHALSFEITHAIADHFADQKPNFADTAALAFTYAPALDESQRVADQITDIDADDEPDGAGNADVLAFRRTLQMRRRSAVHYPMRCARFVQRRAVALSRVVRLSRRLRRLPRVPESRHFWAARRRLRAVLRRREFVREWTVRVRTCPRCDDPRARVGSSLGSGYHYRLRSRRVYAALSRRDGGVHGYDQDQLRECVFVRWALRDVSR